MTKKCMASTYDMIYLHGLYPLHEICVSSIACRQRLSSLHIWEFFLIPCDQWLCTYMIFALGLTRSNKGRNLIFVILNEICLLSMHASIMIFILDC